MYIKNMGIDLGSQYAADLGFDGMEVYVDEASSTVVTDIDDSPGTGGKKKKKKRKKKQKTLDGDGDEGDDDHE